MPCYLDNQALPTSHLADDATVEQVLDLARAQAALAGSLIVGLRCEHEMVPTERLGWLLVQPVRDFERIDLITGHPKEVVLEALEQTQAVFGQTFSLIKQCSDDLSNGRISEGMQAFTDCVTAWGCAHNAVMQSADLLGISFEGLRVDGRPASFWLEGLAAKLAEVKTAIEARDHVQLCDILRYEMDETLREWEQVVDEFIRHVRRTDCPSSVSPANHA